MSCKENESKVNQTDMEYQWPWGLHEKDGSSIIFEMV